MRRAVIRVFYLKTIPKRSMTMRTILMKKTRQQRELIVSRQVFPELLITKFISRSIEFNHASLLNSQFQAFICFSRSKYIQWESSLFQWLFSLKILAGEKGRNHHISGRNLFLVHRRYEQDFLCFRKLSKFSLFRTNINR